MAYAIERREISNFMVLNGPIKATDMGWDPGRNLARVYRIEWNAARKKDTRQSFRNNLTPPKLIYDKVSVILLYARREGEEHTIMITKCQNENRPNLIFGF